MSRKNKFKRRKEHVIPEAKHEEIHRNIAEKTQNEYSMVSDFIGLFGIIIFYTGIVVGLYYYDMQTHILATVADRLMSSI